MKTIITSLTLAAAAFLSACKSAPAVSEGSAATAVVAPKPKPQQSIDTSKPETLLEAAPDEVDEETKKTVEREIAKRKDSVKNADSLLEEAKKHMSEEDLEEAVKKLKSAIKGYGDKKPE